eukprot:Nk52_evm69s554 gene=Nk52_evmTU69s554
MVGQGVIEVDPVKRKRIMDWPMPKKGKDVEQLVGLLGWIRSHIPHYQALVGPFEKVKKNRWIDQTEKLKKAFKNLKEVVSRLKPLHAIPDDATLKLANSC